MTLVYPLQWPAGWPRTDPKHQGRARYTVTFDKTRRQLRAALRRLDPYNEGRAVISTNIPVRRDGEPYASAREPEDPGVAVYFFRDGNHEQQLVLACDQWWTVRSNLRACYMAIEAMRQLERCGASTVVDRAFAGFVALPAGTDDWRTVLGLPQGALTVGEVHYAYRRLAARHHPDRGGDPNEMARINIAHERAMAELGNGGL